MSLKPDLPSAPAARKVASQGSRWPHVRALTAVLLLAWAGISFGVVWQARALDFVFFGWPFSFWWAAQGAPLAFLCLVAVYAWTMHRLDVRHGVDEQD